MTSTLLAVSKRASSSSSERIGAKLGNGADVVVFVVVVLAVVLAVVVVFGFLVVAVNGARMSRGFVVVLLGLGVVALETQRLVVKRFLV